jgi:undecaprenyl-diphosphatase
MTRDDRRWALAALLSASARRLRDAWRGLDRRATRRCAAWLAGGGAACAALSAALALAGAALAGRGVLDGEAQLVRDFAARGPLDFQQALFLSQPGSTALIAPLALVGAWIAIARDRPLRAVALLAAALATKLVVGAGWLAWPRARPELIAGGIAAPQGLGAFPSGHVAQTVAFYGLLVCWWCARSRSPVEKALAWALLAALVTLTAAARLRLGAHWPSDLAAGALVGGAWLAACALAARGGVSS